MQIEKIKNDLILKEGLKYFDFAASGLACNSVEREIERVLRTYANTHSLGGENAHTTSEYYENARAKIKEMLGCAGRYYLISCGFGATAAIKKLWEILGIYLPPNTKKRLNLTNFATNERAKFPLIVISPYEHHSVEISLRQALCELVRVPLGADGLMDFGKLNEILGANKGREIYGVFSACSNATGILVDYKQVFLALKMHGAKLFIDASALVAHDNVDLGFCDGLFFGAHKLIGGVGACGILALKKEFLEGAEPTFAGGGAVKYADFSTQSFVIDKERLEEPGTPGITALIRAYLALDLRRKVGFATIKERESALNAKFIDEISKIKEIKIYGNLSAPRVPIFAFNMQNLASDALASVLSSKFEIQTRSGCDCAAPYGFDLTALAPDPVNQTKPSWVRASFSWVNDEDDIAYLAHALKEIVKIRTKINFVSGKYRC
ncbi:aminotransferase class V-fold PLP-dependent enzyme [Campylobacter sp. VBCF_06 NA8]|uniref:aminotransferase class V-fold PLP-dependent enzyme n=1 Tax=Campylobacter sp. VBCF_06 NA8 TaxID=2983822 RepID=UPI0022E9E701|nr:aminotransferase class V-fold PLP-dependent enzyme [Campylobacter sp. VBCF_06 NA8]MDA3046804.1 aminotransferase class V-fold PLP-dependent enzyme [Campylobacter sp. VBCF_06 NA8]